MTLTTQIPTDPKLPYLATICNAEVMETIWQSVLFPANGNHFQIESCQILRAKYKPGKNCLVSYQLHVRNQETNSVDSQIITARTYPPGQAQSRYNKAHKTALTSPKVGQPLLYLAGLETVAWLFPNDRKLIGLPQLMDIERLQNHEFDQIVTQHFGPEWQIADLSHSLVHYVPEHTCTVRCQLQLQHRQTGQKQQPVFYGKTYYDADEGQTAYDMMHQLKESEAQHQGRLHTAVPLTYSANNQIMWQLGLPGSTLSEFGWDDPGFDELLATAAETVAALHQSKVACRQTSSLNDWIEKLVEVKTQLSKAKPTSAQLITTVVDRLLQQAANVTDQPYALLHADLHLKNFLVHEGRISLIDLDSLCYGPPAQDIGSFVANVLYQGLLNDMPAVHINAIITDFCHSYCQQIPWPLSSFTLNWYIAAALINERILRCMTRLKTGRLDIVDDLLMQADRFSKMNEVPENGYNNYASYVTLKS